MGEPRYYDDKGEPTFEATVCATVEVGHRSTSREARKELARLQRERDEARSKLAEVTAEQDRLRRLLADLARSNEDAEELSSWRTDRSDVHGQPVPPTPDPRLKEAMAEIDRLQGVLADLLAGLSRRPVEVNRG